MLINVETFAAVFMLTSTIHFTIFDTVTKNIKLEVVPLYFFYKSLTTISAVSN